MKANVVQAIGDTKIPTSWQRYASYAMNTIPEDRIPYLSDDYVDEIRQTIRLSDTNIMSLKEAMRFIREDDSLRHLFWLWHCILFRKADEGEDDVANWPTPLKLKGMKGNMAGLFPAVVILSGYDSILSIYKNIGHIPNHIISDTLTTVEEYMNIYREEKGYHGLSMFHLNRLLQHFRAELFRVGRLEYHMISLKNPILVYRNKTDGREIVLSQPGIHYRQDGHVDGTNQLYGEEAWVSSFCETKNDVKGHVITPEGYAKNDFMLLPKNEWECVLKEGDPVLAVHIPRKGILTEDICIASLQEAEKFFRDFFSE